MITVYEIATSKYAAVDASKTSASVSREFLIDGERRIFSAPTWEELSELVNRELAKLGYSPESDHAD